MKTECFFNYPICLRAPVFLRITAKTRYLITEGQVSSIIFFFEVTLFLTNPQKTAGNSAGVVRDALLFDRLHFSTFPRFQGHLELSSKIRSSLYFFAAITFERFKTFCLHCLHVETKTFTRERDLIPIGILSNRIQCQRKDSDEVFSTYSFKTYK